MSLSNSLLLTLNPNSPAVSAASSKGSLAAKRNIIAASAVFSFLFAWNDFLWPLIVTNSTEMRPIQVGLAFFQGQYGTFWTLLMAATVLAILPAVLAFLAAQRRFIEGITSSGLKG